MALALQLLVVGISQAAIYVLVAVGFAMILAVSKIFHFAHASMLALAGFLVFFFVEQLGLPFLVGVLLSAVATCGAAVALYAGIYTPLERRQASQLTIVLAAVGIQFAVENTLGLIWGTGGRFLRNPMADVSYTIGPVLITLTDVAAVLLAIVGATATVALLRWTRLGRAMRAYSENPVMARVVGVDPMVVGSTAMIVASLLLVPAALITGWYSSLVPSMGMGPLLYAVAAVVVGGIGSVMGAALGALILGLLSAAISFKFPAFWSDAGAFLLMMMFVIWFPSGLFGVRSRSHSAR